MQIQHIGYRIKGFYRATRSGHRWSMNAQAQRRMQILRFRHNHATTTCNAFAVSRHPLPVAAPSGRPGQPGGFDSRKQGAPHVVGLWPT